MSSQKGNVSRTRPQKHKNRTVFKNNLHDTSHITKQINSIQIANVCQRCKDLLEWKIKYKKFKPLKAASTCVVCHEKCVKHAYHTRCGPCANKAKICPKCGVAKDLIAPAPAAFDRNILKTAAIRDKIKALPERRRRTFDRFVEKTLADGSGDGEKDVKDVILEKLNEMSLNAKGGEDDDDFDDFLDDDDEEDDDVEEGSEDEGEDYKIGG